MISNILRKILSYLSIWYPNKKISSKKDIELRNFISKKLTKTNVNKKDLKKLIKNLMIKLEFYLKAKILKTFLDITLFKKCFFYIIDFLYIKNSRKLENQKIGNISNTLLKRIMWEIQ